MKRFLIPTILATALCLAFPATGAEPRTWTFTAPDRPALQTQDGMEWVQGESVSLEYALPSPLADGQTALWEITQGSNLYSYAAAAADGNALRWNLAPDETTLPPGRYAGRVAVYSTAGGTTTFHRVLAMQGIRVYKGIADFEELQPVPWYDGAALDALEGTVATNAAAIADLNDATNALDLAVAALDERFVPMWPGWYRLDETKRSDIDYLGLGVYRGRSLHDTTELHLFSGEWPLVLKSASEDGGITLKAEYHDETLDEDFRGPITLDGDVKVLGEFRAPGILANEGENDGVAVIRGYGRELNLDNGFFSTSGYFSFVGTDGGFRFQSTDRVTWNGDGLATTNDLAAAVAPVAGAASTNAANLSAHAARTDNPHGVTAAQAGALPVAWTNAAVLPSLTIGTRATGYTNGIYSTASGNNNIADKEYSAAFGWASQARSTSAFAAGGSAKALGFSSIALGNNAYANGLNSVAIGFETQSGASRSVAMGYRAVSSNDDAFVWSGTGAYGSHGTGSFSINPAGGMTNFWVGQETLGGRFGALENRLDSLETYYCHWTSGDVRSSEINWIPTNDWPSSDIALYVHPGTMTNLFLGIRGDWEPANDSHLSITLIRGSMGSGAEPGGIFIGENKVASFASGSTSRCYDFRWIAASRVWLLEITSRTYQGWSFDSSGTSNTSMLPNDEFLPEFDSEQSSENRSPTSGELAENGLQRLDVLTETPSNDGRIAENALQGLEVEESESEPWDGSEEETEETEPTEKMR